MTLNCLALMRKKMKKYVTKSTRHSMFNSMHRLLTCVSILHEFCTLLHPLSILRYLSLQCS